MFEEDTSDKAIIRAVHRQVDAVHRQEMREARQQRIEALQAVDRAVARTVRTLRSTGQLDNTYIVFTSDNGYVLGEHNLDGKLWYFREIAGIPMYIRGPGIAKGARSDTPVTNADWAPTFAALADAKPTRKVDGTNVLPWLDTRASRRVVPIEGYPVQGGTTPLYTGVVVGPWTYVENKRGTRGALLPQRRPLAARQPPPGPALPPAVQAAARPHQEVRRLRRQRVPLGLLPLS